MAYFKPKSRLTNEQSAGHLSLVIANSQTLVLGSAVKVTSGFIVPATAGTKVLGVVVGFVDQNGRPIDTTFAIKNWTGTFTTGAPGTQSYAASSTNQTGDKVRALVNVDQNCVFVNDSAGTLTTAMLFSFFDLTSATQVGTYVGALEGQFQLVMLDPDNDGSTTKGGFLIAESVLNAFTQS